MDAKDNKPIEKGDEIEIEGILFRVVRIKPNARKLILEAIGKIQQEANA